MQGNDVKSIQRALAAANISVDQGGVYNPATAGAVAVQLVTEEREQLDELRENQHLPPFLHERLQQL